jgi:hypothetical protein
VAQIERDAAKMRMSAQARDAGDRAIQAQAGDADLEQAQQEIARAAEARRRQLAQQAAVPADVFA